MARRHAEVFLHRGAQGPGLRTAQPAADVPESARLLRVEPHSDGLRDRIWWGLELERHVQVGRKLRHEPAELTLKDDRA